MSDSLWPHGLQHTRLPCPSPIAGAYSNSCPSSWWCHPTISSSAVPFSSCLQQILGLINTMGASSYIVGIQQSVLFYSNNFENVKKRIIEIKWYQSIYILNEGPIWHMLGFPGGSDLKNLPAVRGTQIWPLGGKDLLEKGMATHSSILAWENSMDRGAVATVHGISKSWTWLSVWASHDILPPVSHSHVTTLW